MYYIVLYPHLSGPCLIDVLLSRAVVGRVSVICLQGHAYKEDSFLPLKGCVAQTSSEQQS